MGNGASTSKMQNVDGKYMKRSTSIFSKKKGRTPDPSTSERRPQTTNVLPPERKERIRQKTSPSMTPSTRTSSYKNKRRQHQSLGNLVLPSSSPLDTLIQEKRSTINMPPSPMESLESFEFEDDVRTRRSSKPHTPSAAAEPKRRPVFKMFSSSFQMPSYLLGSSESTPKKCPPDIVAALQTPRSSQPFGVLGARRSVLNFQSSKKSTKQKDLQQETMNRSNRSFSAPASSRSIDSSNHKERNESQVRSSFSSVERSFFSKGEGQDFLMDSVEEFSQFTFPNSMAGTGKENHNPKSAEKAHKSQKRKSKKKKGKKNRAVKFKDGSRIEARYYLDRHDWYPGYIINFDADELKYEVKFDDGDTSKFRGRYIRSRKMDTDGVSAAAYHGFMNVVQEYYESQNHHADVVNDLDSSGGTVLHRACQNGQMDVIKWLLNKKARVDICNESHFCALDFGPYCGHLDLMRLSMGLWGDQYSALLPADAEIRINRRAVVQDFLSVARDNRISLENLYFVRTEALLEEGCFPSFHECASRQLHMNGLFVLNQPGDVLLVSRRIGSLSGDEWNSREFDMFEDFIEVQHSPPSFVWVEYSCLQSDLCSFSEKEEWQKRGAYALVLLFLLATNCLVLPNLQTVGSSHLIPTDLANAKITDVRGHLSSAASLFEIMGALLGGQDVYIAYILGNADSGNAINTFRRVHSWSRFEEEESVDLLPESDTGLHTTFEMGGLQSLPKELLVRKKKGMWKNALGEFWGIKMDRDPLVFLSKITGCVAKYLSEDTSGGLLESCACFQFDEGIHHTFFKWGHFVPEFVTIYDLISCIGMDESLKTSVGFEDGEILISILVVLLIYCTGRLSTKNESQGSDSI